jgi:hypothetical protein
MAVMRLMKMTFRFKGGDMNIQRITYMDKLTASMSHEQKQTVVQILEDVDLAFRLKNSTIHRELKAQRDKHTGKIKRLLTTLAKHPDTILGVDWLFEQKQEGKL